MIANASNFDWSAIVAVIVGFVLTSVGGLVAYSFINLARKVEKLERHLRGMLWTLWEISSRMDGVEDYLEDKDPRFRPSRRPFPQQSDKLT